MEDTMEIQPLTPSQHKKMLELQEELNETLLWLVLISMFFIALSITILTLN